MAVYEYTCANYGAEERRGERAATLSGLMGLLLGSPRVARSSQPWAEGCNPFGIERNGPPPQTRVEWEGNAAKQVRQSHGNFD